MIFRLTSKLRCPLENEANRNCDFAQPNGRFFLPQSKSLASKLSHTLPFTVSHVITSEILILTPGH